MDASSNHDSRRPPPAYTEKPLPSADIFEILDGYYDSQPKSHETDQSTEMPAYGAVGPPDRRQMKSYKAYMPPVATVVELPPPPPPPPAGQLDRRPVMPYKAYVPSALDALERPPPPPVGQQDWHPTTPHKLASFQVPPPPPPASISQPDCLPATSHKVVPMPPALIATEFPPPPASQPDWRPMTSHKVDATPLAPSLAGIPPPPPPPAAPAAPAASKSFWETALSETVYFAGGLVSRPFESTKHHSILRHSFGLVYYRGPATSIAITIFADAPLPADRTFWLQRKGFSGDMGMNVSTLFGTSTNWIDATPVSEALPSQLPESDERSWQRDMDKFVKKAATDKHLAKHVARETSVIRIPALASDGYLRILMCTGEGNRRKVLCPSPVFRVASTSSDVSVMRGASLATLPIEVGLKAVSVIGNNTVNRYVGPAKALVGSRVQKVSDKLKPGRIEQFAAAKAGLKPQFDVLEEAYASARDTSYAPLHEQVLFDHAPGVVGPDSGPESPFPIKLQGQVTPGTGQGQAVLGYPTANLTGVSSDLLLRLKGVYIGWASIQPRDGLTGVSLDWHQAIITIGPSSHGPPSIVSSNEAAVYMMHDFGSSTFVGATLKVIIMAYIRPAPAPGQRQRQPLAEAQAAVSNDIDIAFSSLSRENWTPHTTLRTLREAKSARGLSDRYVEARSQLQKHADSMPLHRAGIRTADAELRDQALGRGGLYIKR